jgi:glycosyltransferase involved in cell wall biosynthesis
LLSAVLILRNAEAYIADCLNSIKDLCGEIICVVDTRTTDNTKTILEKFPVTVFDYNWLSNSFADARNFGIDRVTNEWVLTIDADETLSEKACAQIKELIR